MLRVRCVWCNWPLPVAQMRQIQRRVKPHNATKRDLIKLQCHSLRGGVFTVPHSIFQFLWTSGHQGWNPA